METAAKIAVVNQYIAAFGQADIDVIREIYAADGVVEDPVGTEPKRGMEAIVEFYESAMAMGVRLELTGAPRCAGNAVAFPFEALMGELQVPIIDVFEFNAAGKIAHMKAYWGDSE